VYTAARLADREILHQYVHGGATEVLHVVHVLCGGDVAVKQLRVKDARDALQRAA
jgi:hypothetical protein